MIIVAFIIGVLICITLFFGLIEYTFSFFNRLFASYDYATFALLIVAFIVSKFCNRKVKEPIVENVQRKDNLEIYAQISEVLFFILRDYATEFSAVPPRDVVDIQETNRIFIEKYNVNFYQFHCEKADISHPYSKSELDNIKSRMQRKMDLDIKTGRFPSIDINSIFLIDAISDYTYDFGIQVVIPDDNFYNYKRSLDLRKKTYGKIQNTSETWDEE